MAKIENFITKFDDIVAFLYSKKWIRIIFFPVIFLLILALYCIFCLKNGTYTYFGFRNLGCLYGFYAIIIILSVICGLYLIFEGIFHRLNSKKVIVILLLGASFCLLSYGFANSLNYGNHHHDASVYSSGSHWTIIYQIYNNKEIPDATTTNQFYNFKVYHVLMALGMAINGIFVHFGSEHAPTSATNVKNFPNYSITQYQQYDMCRIYLCFIGILSLFFIYKVFKAMGLRKGLLATALGITIFIPQMWYIHFFGNQDGLVVLLSLISIYYALKFKKSGKWHAICLTALFLGLATMTKFAAGIISIPIGVLVIARGYEEYRAGKEKFDKFVLKFFVLFIIAVPLCFALPVWYKILYNVPIGFNYDVAKTLAARKKYSMYIDPDYYNWFQRFASFPNGDLFFSPFNMRVRSTEAAGAYVNNYGDIDFNVWTGFIKTLFFDEWNYQNISTFYGGFITGILMAVEYIYAIGILVAIVASLIYFFRTVTKKIPYEKGIFALFIIAFTFSLIGYYIWFNGKYPYGFNQNSRLIPLLIIPINLLLAKAIFDSKAIIQEKFEEAKHNV